MTADRNTQAVYVAKGLLKAADEACKAGFAMLNGTKAGRDKAKLFHDFEDRLRAMALGERESARRAGASASTPAEKP